MASLIKRSTSKFWAAAFRDVQGRQHRRSTGEIDKKRAQAIADQYERVAQRKGNPQRVRQTFAEFFRDHYAQDVPFLSVRDFTSRWLAARKAETSPATFRRYDEVVRKFLGFLGAGADRGLDEINKTQILAFRDAQIASTAAATTNTALAIVKMVFRSARREGYLWQDPAEGVKNVKGAATIKRRAFTVDELRRVLAVAGPEWQSLIKCGLYTGQRLSDLAMVTWAQIDLERDEITLTTRKTGKRLLVPIASPLREHLLSLPAGSDNPHTPIHPRAFELVCAGRVATLSYQFGELLADAGLREPRTGRRQEDKRAGMDVSFHCLRHTAVSLLKDAGIPDAVVMALVGHESVAMSAHYTHVGREALAKAAASMPEI
jgi:integrase